LQPVGSLECLCPEACQHVPSKRGSPPAHSIGIFHMCPGTYKEKKNDTSRKKIVEYLG
jgi:hypothetical protein